MKTTTHVLTVQVETHQRIDAPIEVGRVFLNGAPVALPPEAMSDAFKFALVHALVFAGQLDDDAPEHVRTEIDRSLG